MRAGSYISFSTDFSVTQGGFQLCFTAATEETTDAVESTYTTERCPEDIFMGRCNDYCCGFDSGDQNVRENWSYFPGTFCDECLERQEGTVCPEGSHVGEPDDGYCYCDNGGSQVDPSMAASECSETARPRCHDFCPLSSDYCQYIGYSDGAVDEIVDCDYMASSCFEIVASGSVFGESTVLKGCMNAPNTCDSYREFARTIGATMESCTLSDGSDHEEDVCGLCAQNNCYGEGSCLLIEEQGQFTCEVDPGHFTSQLICDNDYGHWCSSCVEEETECDDYYSGDWSSLSEECQCITASVDYTDGSGGGVNGCKSCDGWMCAECFDGFMMNEWNMCVRMTTTTTEGPSSESEDDSSEEESSMEDSYQDVWSENYLFHMMGNCDVVGDCVSSNNFPGSYGNNEYCSISVMQDSEVSVDQSFMLETCCDNLYIDGVDVENSQDVPQRMRAGSYISFSTDFSVTEGGFKLCFTAATGDESTMTPTTGNECTACVNEFVMYGGCECWVDEMCEVDDMIPVGCDPGCAEDAAMACGIDWEDTSMDDDEHECEYGFFNIERTCEYYGSFCEDPDAIDGCLDCSHCDESDRMMGQCPECPYEEQEDYCADLACGEPCVIPCPEGLMCPTVMHYCQADGSCGMNSQPECDTTEEPEVTYCSGMMGDYDCVCESGEKYAVFHGGYDTTMSPTTEPTYMMVRGRRRAAIYGEDMYCAMENSCIHSEEVDDAFAGSISSYYNCMNLDTWEVYDVSTYNPINGDVMPEGSSYAYCDDYAFSCYEEGMECDDYYNGDWFSLSDECQCITGSVIEWTDHGDGTYGGVNGCKSCDGWMCAECFDGFVMGDWGCVREETTTEPAGAFFEMEGDCEVVDDCVQSANYPGSYGNNERCDIRMLRDADLTSGRRFSLETCCDHLMINGVDVESADMLPNSLTAGTTFTFTTDYSVTRGGWQICFSEMAPETMEPSFMPTEMPLSASPSQLPSKDPSSSPTFFTKKPSTLPTAVPIVSLPTAAPTADCSDNPEWTNARGWDCERAVRKRVNLGSTCVNEAMITNCCASCAEADAMMNTGSPTYDEIICPDGYAYNGEAEFVDVDGDTTVCSGVNYACNNNGCNMDEVHAYMINTPCCTVISPEPTNMPTPTEVVSTSYFDVSGDCDVMRNCVSSKNYPSTHGNHEQCTITILADAAVRVGTIFEVEMCCDNLYIQGQDIHSRESVPGFLAAGETIRWNSDYSVTSRGWQLCFSEFTEEPTFMPTHTNPSNMPSVMPSFAPTGTPTNKPSPYPSEDPTSSPSSMPTVTPTETPSADPTSSPTPSPTEMPTQSPTMMPSPTPSTDPTTTRPTERPTEQPTERPTEQPTESPTTLKPTEMPTVAPSRCYPPDAVLLASMGKLFERGPSADRFTKVKQRAAAILQDAKIAQGKMCDDIDRWVRNIKRIGKQDYTEDRFNKMENTYNDILANL